MARFYYDFVILSLIITILTKSCLGSKLQPCKAPDVEMPINLLDPIKLTGTEYCKSETNCADQRALGPFTNCWMKDSNCPKGTGCCFTFHWPFLDGPHKNCPHPSVQVKPKAKPAPAPKKSPKGSHHESLAQKLKHGLENVKDGISDGLQDIHVPKKEAEALGIAGAVVAGAGAVFALGRA